MYTVFLSRVGVKTKGDESSILFMGWQAEKQVGIPVDYSFFFPWLSFVWEENLGKDEEI